VAWKSARRHPRGGAWRRGRTSSSEVTSPALGGVAGDGGRGGAAPAPAPAGVPLAPPPPPATVETRVEAPDLSGPRDVIQTVQDLPPNVFAAPHTHPGPNFAVLVQGQVTLTRAPGGDSNYVAGDSWIEAANLLHWAQFGDSGAYQYTATVVPSGAPRAIPAAAPAPAAPAPAPAQVP
jgi:quercetin dioxygenase-like cupin family protein